MKKIAIILDSFSGRSKTEVEKIQDCYFLDLKIIIDGKEYRDGIDLSSAELMALSNKAKDIKTSQPSPGIVEDLFLKLSREYENVIYLSIGSPISGTFQSAKMIANEFKNVHVIDNALVGQSFELLANYLIKEAQTKEIDYILNKASEYGKNILTMIIPRDNQAFIRSGRLGKAAAYILSTLKAVAIIEYSFMKLSKKMVKRSGISAFKWTWEKLIEPIKKDLSSYVFQITHTLDETFAKAAKQYAEKLYGITIHYERTSGIINAHTGDGAFSISVYKKEV